MPYPSPFKNGDAFYVIYYKVLIPCSFDQESWYRYFLLNVCWEERGGGCKAGYAQTYFLSESGSSKAICTYYRLGTAVIDGIFIQNESSFSCCIAHRHLIPAIVRKVGSRAQNIG